jgi:FKBP-type peptidyl-prolyl cis-trans isomerase FkpA
LHAQLINAGVVRILRKGNGQRPDGYSTVKLHDDSSLTNGLVFDSAMDRGVPAVFPLSRVIPCWTEAVGRMRVGAKAEVTCPPSTAYGEKGRPPAIPPNSVLHFKVELLEIM